MKIVRGILVLFILIFADQITIGQTIPAIKWQKAYGGTQTDRANDFVKTFDGGYIVAAYSRSSTGNLTSNKGGYDIWIIKLNRHGEIEWQKSYGGERDDYAYSIKQTTDSGYIVAGSTASFKGLFYVDQDVWILKLSQTGVVEWQRIIRGSGEEAGNSAIQTADGGYAVAGYTTSSDGDITEHRGSYLVIKLNEDGTTQWQKTFGGTRVDQAKSIIETRERDFVVVGRSSSTDNDVTDNQGLLDYWLLKLDSAGNKIWAKSFGGIRDDWASCVIQTRDGGYLIGGSSSSFTAINDWHCWMIKTDTSGVVQWTTPVNAANTFYVFSLDQTTDDGFVAGGYSYSSFPGDHGAGDFWFAKFNQNGKFQWQKFMGGNANDFGITVRQTNDEGYVFVGLAGSTTMDVSGNHGDFDAWIVKLGAVNDNLSVCQSQPSISFTSEVTGSAYQWQVNAGNGYEDISDNIYYSGTGTATLQLTNIPSSWYNYRYRCFADSTTNKTFTLKFTNTWTGAVDSTWENPGNWSCNTVPDINTDVIINTGIPRLNSHGLCRSLNLSANARLNILEGQKLEISGREQE